MICTRDGTNDHAKAIADLLRFETDSSSSTLDVDKDVYHWRLASSVVDEPLKWRKINRRV